MTNSNQQLQPQLREITLDSYEESIALSQFAFQYTFTTEELAQRKRNFLSSYEQRIGYFEGERLCAQAALLSLEVYINEVKYKMGGIAGVSTWPEHRRKGYVASLITELLIRMKKNGQSISMLHPFSFAFYRRYGWETYVELKDYEMESSQLPARKPFKGSIERTDKLEALMEAYEHYAKRYNGMLSRSSQWWQNRIATRKKGIYAIYRSESGNIEGYVIYEVKQSEMKIHEFIAWNIEAETALWHYISQHDSMIKTVQWTAPSDDQFPFTLDNPRVKQTITPYFMARIVDVKAFFQQYRFETSEQEDTFYIEVDDQHAPWNNELYQIIIAKDGSCNIEAVTKISESNIIKLNINTLTTLLMNYQKISNLQRIGRVKGDTFILNRLQKRISERICYLADFF